MCITFQMPLVRLTERALNYFNAWVVMCKHKAFQGMVNAGFSTHALNAYFSKRMYNMW